MKRLSYAIGSVLAAILVSSQDRVVAAVVGIFADPQKSRHVMELGRIGLFGGILALAAIGALSFSGWRFVRNGRVGRATGSPDGALIAQDVVMEMRRDMREIEVNLSNQINGIAGDVRQIRTALDGWQLTISNEMDMIRQDIKDVRKTVEQHVQRKGENDGY